MAAHSSILGATLLVILLVVLLPFEVSGRTNTGRFGSWVRSLVGREIEEEGDGGGTRWAVLVAGSNGYENYRHQADVCHAYQILKKGGLKDENIVVFMYDDIANNVLNPRPGVIINSPQGDNVYVGVPKDYTGAEVTVANLLAVLLGDRNAVSGGSRKVIDSKPNDRIFLYYADHGGPGSLGMPNLPFLYANDLIEVLKRKHALGTYREMVIYIEACESGSVFEGLMPEDLNIYVTTASNAVENSWATYCSGSIPSEYTVCLGDLYSVAWMEDSESHNLRTETIQQQYDSVRLRTSNSDTYNAGSHVMEYGNKNVKAAELYLFQGFDPATENLRSNSIDLSNMVVVNQRDSDLVFLNEKYKRMEDGSENKGKVLKLITDIEMHRKHLVKSMEMIGMFLFGKDKGFSALQTVREPGMPLVNDWDCLKAMVRLFEGHCGSLTQYGMKYMRSFANICNAGVSQSAAEKAFMGACKGHDKNGVWSSLKQGGFSA